MKLLIVTYVLFQVIGFSTFGQTQIHKNTELEVLTKSCLDKMYNYEFAEAEKLHRELSLKAPDHPAVKFISGLLIFWENFPLLNNATMFAKHEAELQKSLAISEKRLEKNENELEAVFFAMSVRALLARYHAANGDYLAAVGEGKKTYRFIKQSKALANKFGEMYFPVGLYNYYREKYPELHPVYKPFMWFFESGSKSTGLAELEKCSKENIFTRIEATFFLGHIYLRYENNYTKGLAFSKKLIDEFPNNLVFTTKYLEGLVANKNYAAIELYTPKLLAQKNNTFYLMTGHLFQGIAEEKKHHNLEKAKTHYLEALKLTEKVGKMSEDYYGFIYMGLSRIAIQQGDEDLAEDYQDEAEDYPLFNIMK